jgi:phosphoribosylformimino-5-aminoimidazole carboxamide ribotide isomerase
MYIEVTAEQECLPASGSRSMLASSERHFHRQGAKTAKVLKEGFVVRLAHAKSWCDRGILLKAAFSIYLGGLWAFAVKTLHPKSVTRIAIWEGRKSVSQIPPFGSSLVVPVVDIRQGLAVHAVAGERERYRPWTDGAGGAMTPQALAEQFATQWRPRWLYVADLDGIVDGQPQPAAWPRLPGLATRILIDAGFRREDEVRAAIDRGYDVILGTESLPSLEWVGELITSVGETGRLWISLDFRSGQWQAPAAIQERGLIASIRQLAAWGVTQWIVLDVADVGSATGGSTREQIATLRGTLDSLDSTNEARTQAAPAPTLLAGGGMRTAADVRNLQATGVDGILVATALMTGAINPGSLL